MYGGYVGTRYGTCFALPFWRLELFVLEATFLGNLGNTGLHTPNHFAKTFV